MWNQIKTDEYEAMLAETVKVPLSKEENRRAYMSRPLGNGPYPGVIIIPHMPGWDELNREMARRFSSHGYIAISPNIFEEFGHGLPSEVSGKAREAGGVTDDSVMATTQATLDYLVSLPYSNGKVGIIGMCSGGRHAFLAGCRVEGLSAVVDCWGGRVVTPEDQLTPANPVAPISLTAQLSAPLLGIFGNEDRSPTPEDVNIHEEELKKHGKEYEFHRYDDAGHAFWSYDREAYRPVQAMDSWGKVFDFFGKHLS
ncbi:MAG: dienelactone hydrolase family protein [Oscillospiraceae bacterium]|nr:dienelactone hydrolase family protein [Oscillospiraceae bacterium]